MTTPALYQLSGEYNALMHKLDSLDLDAQTIADTIESSGLTDAIEIKAQGVEMVARQAVQYVPSIDAEIERLQALKAQRERVAKGLRDYLKSCMESAQIEKITCPYFTISIAKNPPAVDVFDVLSIPSQYMVTPEPKPPVAAPDKKAIAAALKAGEEVPGARMTQGTRLKIA
jgi:Siphovirus Gp157